MMRNKNEVPSKFHIGCNIVDPEADSIAAYTKDIYFRSADVYKEFGIEYLEFSHLLALNVADAKAVSGYCKSLGFIPWAVHSEHLNPENTVDEYLSVQTHCAEVADALDARVMVCHLPNFTPRFDFENACGILTRLADITRRFNVKLAIENCAFADDVDFIIRIVDRINREDVGINFDSGHAHALGDGHPSCAACLEKIGKRLLTTHLHDNFGTNDDHQAPGIGTINWSETLSAIRRTGYAGPLMMELTGAAVKARRAVPQLRNFPLDKELIIAKSYFEYLAGSV